MFIPWWLIIIGVIVVAGIASSGRNTLQKRVEELETRVEALEEEQENEVSDYELGEDNYL